MPSSRFSWPQDDPLESQEEALFEGSPYPDLSTNHLSSRPSLTQVIQQILYVLWMEGQSPHWMAAES